MTSTMTASVERGDLPKLPIELCSSTLQEIVAVFREEIIQILRSLVSTRNSEIRRLLVRLEIVDTKEESTDQPPMVFCL